MFTAVDWKSVNVLDGHKALVMNWGAADFTTNQFASIVNDGLNLTHWECVEFNRLRDEVP